MGPCPWTSAATSTGTTTTGSSIRRPRGSFPRIQCGPKENLAFVPPKGELGLSGSLAPRSSGDRAEFFSECAEDLRGSDDFREGDALVGHVNAFRLTGSEDDRPGDRKSTRLNSSHMSISYAVFCLKKKKKNDQNIILDKKKKTKN